MPWGVAAATAAGSIASGIIGSNAAGDAAKAQVAATNQASQTELNMFDQTSARFQPYVDAGTNGLASLQNLLGLGGPGGGTSSSPILQMLGIGTPGTPGTGSIDPSKFQGSPGYQFQLQQGMDAVTNSAAAHGGLGGNALRALQSTGQGLANQDWNQYLGNAGNAWQNLVGNVSGVANSGQNAAAKLGTIGTDVAGQVGGNQIGAGNALAAGDMGSAKAIQGMIQGLVSAMGTGAGGGGGMSGLMSLLGGGGGSYSSVDPNNQSVAPISLYNPNLPLSAYANGAAPQGY